MLWTKAALKARLQIPGYPNAQWRPVQGGLQAKIQLEPLQDELRVIVSGPAGRFEWSCKVQAPPESEFLEQAKALKSKGDLVAARAELMKIAADAPPYVRLNAEVEFARLAARQNGGAKVAEHRRQAIEIAKTHGILSAVRDQYLALAHNRLFGQRDVAGARTAFEAAEAVRGAPAGQALLAFTRAFMAQQVHDIRGALDALEDTRVWAQRLGQPQMLNATVMTHAIALAQIGRLQEAWSAINELHGSSSKSEAPCARALRLQNRGWIALLATEAGQPLEGADADADFAGAIEDLEGTCADPRELPRLWISRALHAVLREDLPAAENALKSADVNTTGASTDFTRLWALDVRGRIALTKGDAPQADLHYRALQDLGERAVSPDAVWRAHVGRAHAAKQAGNLEGSLEFYVLAEDKLEHLMQAAALTQGRDELLTARHTALQGHVGLLLDMGRTSDAAKVLRTGRKRMFRALHRSNQQSRIAGPALAQWQAKIVEYGHLRSNLETRAAESWADTTPQAQAKRKEIGRQLGKVLDEAMQLLALAPAKEVAVSVPDSVLTLTYADWNEGWVAFAERAGEIHVHRATSPATLSSGLLRPFLPQIAGASAIRVLSSGRFEGVDFHALEFEGAPLSTQRVVTYGVDVAGPVSRQSGPPVLIVDPQGNLPGARDEAVAVQALLSNPQILKGFDATGPAVRSAFEGSRLVHYAGHGQYGGRGGWDSALPLADGMALTIGDILALAAVPPHVVLSGCETGRSQGRSGAGLGLAQAFVIAGAQVVIAATRPVEDHTARQLATYLYANSKGDLVEDLHRAQRQLRQDSPSEDWAAFRAFVP